MATIGETAKYVRSKNAGPFWITIDIFCETSEAFEQFKNSKKITPEVIAKIYGVSVSQIKSFFLPDLMVVKFSFPRLKPQGDRYEQDMHGGQQYVRILNLEL
jgi:hypothetical protein